MSPFLLLPLLQEIHRDLREATRASHLRYWEANDGILHWMDVLPRHAETAIESGIHFAAASAWIERLLFTHRARSVPGHHTLRNLSDLERKIPPMLDSLHLETPHPSVVAARLGLLSLTPGTANLPLTNLASHLETDRQIPNRLIASIAVITAHLEGNVIAEVSEPGEGESGIDDFDLDEF